METCVFCQILKEKQDQLILSNDSVFVIFSNPCLMSCHLLVIPKRHVEYPSELSVEERKELFDTALDFQERILKKIASGCDLRQHCRPFQKESKFKVNHVHFHLQPRKFQDEFYQQCQKFETEIFKDLNFEEAKTYKRLLEL